jgi:feruloyl-CoA synthase
VIAAPDRDSVGALIFPHARACRELAGDLGPATDLGAVLNHPAVREKFRGMLDRLAQGSTGSSTLVVRAILLDEPPSLDAREITDKGSINQKAVLENRSALVDELYAAPASSRVLVTHVQSDELKAHLSSTRLFNDD